MVKLGQYALLDRTLARLLRQKGAAALAGAIAFAAKLDYRAIVVWTHSRARKALPVERRPPNPAMASRARLYHRERAQALIEFALIAPFIFVLLFAIVDFSIAIDRRLVLQHAVREGARFGAVHAVCTTIENQTINESQGLLNPSQVTVSYIDKDSPLNGNSGNVGDAVQVKASYPWFPVLGELAGAIGFSVPTITMTPSGTARLEQSVSPTTGC
jgi:hypothetical protein